METSGVQIQIGLDDWPNGCRLTIDGTSHVFPHFLGNYDDCLGDLVRATLLAVTGHSKAIVRADEEPGEWRLIVEPEQIENEELYLRVRVLGFDQYSMVQSDGNGKELFSEVCSANDLAHALLNAAKSQYDLFKQSEAPVQFDLRPDFPVRAMSALEAALTFSDPRAQRRSDASSTIRVRRDDTN